MQYLNELSDLITSGHMEKSKWAKKRQRIFVIVTICATNLQIILSDVVDFVWEEIWLVLIVKMVWIYVAEGKTYT